MSYVEVLDDSAWPVVYARFRGVATTEGYDEYAHWLERQIERATHEKGKIVSINDTIGAIQVSSEVRRHIASWLERHNAAGASAVTAGSFVVINSAVVRGVMTALSWVAKDRMGGVVSVSSVEEAWDGALAALAVDGIPVAVKRPAWLDAARAERTG
jgi:hypothetical protein